MLILLCVFDLDIEFDGKFTATYARRQRDGVGEPFKGPLTTPLEPLHRKLCLGNNTFYVRG